MALPFRLVDDLVLVLGADWRETFTVFTDAAAALADDLSACVAEASLQRTLSGDAPFVLSDDTRISISVPNTVEIAVSGTDMTGLSPGRYAFALNLVRADGYVQPAAVGFVRVEQGFEAA